MNKYITIDDKSYAFNISAINEYLFGNKKTQPREIDITEIYDGQNELQQKQVTESKVTGDINVGAEENIKYDFLKFMLTTLLSNDAVGLTTKTLNFATSISLNTMIKEGFLIEIK